MTPSYNEPPTGSQTGDRDARAMRSQDTHMSVSSVRRRTEDSWVEISSGPSSSSLASPYEEPRRLPEERLPRPRHITLQQDQPRSASATGSSQDEYDESSSESDRVMSSSNEDITHSEDDDDRTALGSRVADPEMFTPQPNAFSHPPLSHRSAPNSYCPPMASTSSEPRQERRPHLERQRTSGSYQPDHDAALRASLTTLLSCAAAVRPKADKAPERVVPRRASIQPTALRLVQEPTAHSARTGKQTKRRSRESSKERSAKKVRAVRSIPAEETISPSITGWIISAGVIVVFSAISFTAGYAWGKEAGIKEGQVALATGGCGREVIRSSRAAGQWNSSVAAY